MNTIACVLKSGLFRPWKDGDYTVQYGPQHVRWLRDQCAAQIKAPHRFVCLSDIDVPGVDVVALTDNLPGWWSKLELFKHFSFASYLDLDSVLLGDVGTFLFNGHKFTMSASLSRKHGVNSSVMSWKGNYDFIYQRFMRDSVRWMNEYRKPHMWGDQDFIRDSMAGRQRIEKFQEKQQGCILSYKHDVRAQDEPRKAGGRRRARLFANWKEQPRVVCFHGAPKAWDTNLPWVPKLCAA